MKNNLPSAQQLKPKQPQQLMASKEWWEGYNAGYKSGTSNAVRYFEHLIKSMEIPGVGPKTTEKIVNTINEHLEGKHS